ncbi:DUF397 domain-containing protein [Nocardiopsis flavescens]
MAKWHKSSYSANGGNCVKAREHTGGADVRDSQNRKLGYLSFPGGEWTALLDAVSSETQEEEPPPSQLERRHSYARDLSGSERPLQNQSVATTD